MNIGQKIILGFVVIAMLFGLAGGAHVAHLMKTSSQIDQIISANLGELESAEEVFYAIQESHSTVLQLLVDSQIKAHEGHVDHINQTRDTIKSNLGKVKAAISSLEKATLEQIANGDPEGEGDELREIQLLKGHVNVFFDLTGKLAALLEAGEYKAANTLSEKDILPVSLAVQALVSDLEMDAKEEIEAALTEAGADIERNIWISIILTFAAFVSAVGLGVMLSRTLAANITKLRETTAQLGKGKLGARVEIDSNDEIGQIAADINQMAAGLRKAIVTRYDFAQEVLGRTRAEKDLHSSEDQVRLLLDSTAEAIYGIDTDGLCTLANAACLRMLGYDDSELVGKNVHELTHHPRPDGSLYPIKECRACHAFREGKEAHVDNESFWRKDGSSFPVSYWAHPVYRYNQITGCVVTFLDISEQIKARGALKESYRQLQLSLEGTVAAVSKSVQARDPYTAGHQKRVTELSIAIAHEMGLDEPQVKGIHMGASIHDIGKIQVPAELLSKPARLNETEYKLIKEHAQIGYDILKDIDFPWPVAEIAHQHHEHMDGSGYPQGLKGDEICLEARIVAVADVVEAINSHRPYRPALGIEVALDEIKKNRGTFYDPEVVDACLKLFSEGRFSFEEAT